MHSFKDNRLLPYKAEFINSIILDIEKYPEFLPWCSNAAILSRTENEIIADLTINFKSFQEAYKSSIITGYDDKKFTINVEAISGPFKKLANFWVIERVNNDCRVNFSIDFEFKSSILDLVVGAFFSIAVDKMINAFEARALYLSKKTVL
jgi:coenzyme Q-binding protein COQ10